MSIQTRILAAAVALTLAGFADAGEFELAPPSAQDTIPARLSSQAAKAAATLESEPVQFAWRLDAAAALQPVAQPHLASSKEYWDRRSADELAAGVAIPTTSAGAIVRLSPVGDGSTKALEARQVILRKGGETYANGAGMQALADSESLEKGSAPFPAGSTVFRIDPALGAGRFELQLPMASGDAVVHGTLILKPMSEAEAKHMAEDGGQDPSKVRGPAMEVQITATSVMLLPAAG